MDLSHRMLDKARRATAKAGFTNINLHQSDARSLPFEDNFFDVVFNNFMLDLIPLDDMPIILKEFWRVLKNGGRLVLVNMSKDKDGMTFYEKVYKATPVRLVPYIYGGCRPVLMAEHTRQAGFRMCSVSTLKTFFLLKLSWGEK